MLNLRYTKERLNEIGVKKDLFYYKVLNESDVRGHNITIEVYMLEKDLSPLFIGSYSANTASYKGNKPLANQIAVSYFNYKFDGYLINNKKVKMYEI